MRSLSLTVTLACLFALVSPAASPRDENGLHIGDRVWTDLDGNGRQSPGEPGLEGVRVLLRDSAGGAIAEVETGTNGRYLFGGLAAAAYRVAIDVGTLPSALAPSHDRDGIESPHQTFVALASDGSRANVDFGYTQPIVLNQLKAFPTAEGAGARTRGGRYGKTVFVTHREDHGEGSLRWALTEPYPRTVMFLVGGNFRLNSELTVDRSDQAYLTVAGESARDLGGVHITGARVQIIDTHDIVLRYVDIKVGRSFDDQDVMIGPDEVVINGTTYEICKLTDTHTITVPPVPPSQCDDPLDRNSRRYVVDSEGHGLVEQVDALQVFNVVNFIADHCTFGWAADEVTTVTGYKSDSHPEGLDYAGYATIQRSLFLEGVLGGNTGSAMGPQLGSGLAPFDKARRYDQHHNAYVHLTHRFFNAGGGRHGIFKNVNNVVYGWASRLANLVGPARHDIISNYYRHSPFSQHLLEKENNFDEAIKRLWKFDFEAGPVDTETLTPNVYVAGNIIELIEEDPTAPNWPYLTHFKKTVRGKPGDPVGPLARENFAPPNRHPITISSAEEAYCDVVNNVGANVRLNADGSGTYVVDSIDASYIENVVDGTGPPSLGNTEDWVFPTLDSDTMDRALLDDDGVPHTWRAPVGIVNRAGYARRELYLAEMAGDFVSLRVGPLLDCNIIR